MKKIRYAVVGNGWRAMFFVRAALNLPERFELTGVWCRSQEKAQASDISSSATLSVAVCSFTL